MISNIYRRIIATRIAYAMLNTPYRWGGDDPIKGFDCSGFVIEILRSVALLPEEHDWTAHDLAFMFPESNVIKKGCLVFFQNATQDRYIHVEYALDEELSIGASGGGSRVNTEQDAERHNAYIKVRPIYKPARIVNPFEQKPYWWVNERP